MPRADETMDAAVEAAARSYTGLPWDQQTSFAQDFLRAEARHAIEAAAPILQAAAWAAGYGERPLFDGDGTGTPPVANPYEETPETRDDR